MSFKIIKNVPPLGRSQRGGGGKAMYNFADMEVGNAFDAPRDMGTYMNGQDKRRSIIISGAYRYCKEHNPTAKFTTILLDDKTVRYRRDA